MKFAFYHTKVYRKNFAIYTTVLGIVCILLYAAITAMMFDGSLQTAQQKSETVFNTIEKEILSYDSIIERYMQGVYTNKIILTDFMYFFGNNAEEYYTNRLLYEAADQFDMSFVNECKKFATQQNNIIKQVNLNSKDKINSIQFSDSGSISIDFSLTSDELQIKNAGPTYKYIYEKTLPMPADYSRQMGKIQFVLDVSPLFKDLENYNFKYAYAITDNSVLPILSQNEEVMNKISNELPTKLSAKRSGSFPISSANTIYYDVNQSSNLQFKLVTAIDSNSIFKENIGNYLLILCGFILFFLVVSIVIAIRMNVDAMYLSKILDYIDAFKMGDFNQSKIEQRNDEYSMIANALNDMSDKIKQHIEQEYLLKLKQQKAEMTILENQINPHFLYNTLEVIRSRALKNKDEVVADAIYNLGSNYRNMLKSDTVITIEKELEMLTTYLKLMEFKHEDNFYYQIDMPQLMRQHATIKFWMQPIVENFFAHGFKNDNQFNLILILGEETETEFVIKFVDNGGKISSKNLVEINKYFFLGDGEVSNEHIGLRNVYLRLRYFYGDKLSMSIENNDEAGITLKVSINKNNSNI